jgi:hypothetical protein
MLPLKRIQTNVAVNDRHQGAIREPSYFSFSDPLLIICLGSADLLGGAGQFRDLNMIAGTVEE